MHSPYGLSQGEFPLAISTSFALEAYVNKDLHTEYKVLAINIPTLVRNWLGSIDYKGELLAKTVGDMVIGEMVFLKGLMRQLKVELIFYGSDLSTLYSTPVMFPYLRKLSAIDVQSYQVTKYILGILNSRAERNGEAPIKGYSGGLYIPGRSILVMSHNNLDYIEPGCTLLESHTGTVKTRMDLHSKYAKMSEKITGEVSFDRLPYCRELLLLLGSRNLFKVKNNSMRKVILEIAHDYQWNPIMQGRRLLEGLQDERIKTYYNSLPHSVISK